MVGVCQCVRRAPAAGAAAAAAAGGEAGAAAAAPPEPRASSGNLGLDPEFLAALPPDIRAELIAQQRAEQRRQAAIRQREAEAAARQAAAAQAAAAPAAAAAAGGEGGAAAAGAAEGGEAGAAGGAGGPDDTDLATLLASFPPDVREDVLLTADEATLASLPAAVREEARVLRQRYRANMFQPEPPMVPRAAQAAAAAVGAAGRAAPGARGAAVRAPPANDQLTLTRRRDQEQEDYDFSQQPELVDMRDIASLVGLLNMSTLPRQSLQHTLLNLCMHAHTRVELLQILLGLIRLVGEAGQAKPAADAAAGGAADMDTDAATGAAAAAPSETVVNVPGMHLKVDPATAPALLRRTLESLTFLVRNSSSIARLLLMLKVSKLPDALTNGIKLPGLPWMPTLPTHTIKVRFCHCHCVPCSHIAPYYVPAIVRLSISVCKWMPYQCKCCVLVSAGGRCERTKLPGRAAPGPSVPCVRAQHIHTRARTAAAGERTALHAGIRAGAQQQAHGELFTQHITLFHPLGTLHSATCRALTS